MYKFRILNYIKIENCTEMVQQKLQIQPNKYFFLLSVFASLNTTFAIKRKILYVSPPYSSVNTFPLLRLHLLLCLSRSTTDSILFCCFGLICHNTAMKCTQQAHTAYTYLTLHTTRLFYKCTSRKNSSLCRLRTGFAMFCDPSITLYYSCFQMHCQPAFFAETMVCECINSFVCSCRICAQNTCAVVGLWSVEGYR